MLKKQMSIEAAIKYVFNFGIIVFLSLVYYVISLVYVIQVNGKERYLNIINTALLLWVFFKLSSFIKRIRKFSDEGGVELKVIYEIFLMIFLVMTGCSFNLEEIKEILNLQRLNNIYIIEKITLYAVISYLYKALSIMKTAIELVMVKDTIFQINGWNLNKTIKEYWNELLMKHKVYILHEDQNIKIPRLWLIRGDACNDIIDRLEKLKIHKSHHEYIELSDSQAEELLRRRRSKGFDDVNDIYEGDSAWFFTPWKTEHFYSLSLRLIDLSYYDEEIIKELINENRGMIQILPSDVKSCIQKKHSR